MLSGLIGKEYYASLRGEHKIKISNNEEWGSRTCWLAEHTRRRLNLNIQLHPYHSDDVIGYDNAGSSSSANFSIRLSTAARQQVYNLTPPLLSIHIGLIHFTSPGGSTMTAISTVGHRFSSKPTNGPGFTALGVNSEKVWCYNRRQFAERRRQLHESWQDRNHAHWYSYACQTSVDIGQVNLAPSHWVRSLRVS